MSNENLKLRTKQFALRIIKLIESLPHDMTANVLGKQLLRSGTSVGANYRAACRSKSAPDFVSKMGTVEEEADESGYWMELLTDSGKIKLAKVSALRIPRYAIAALISFSSSACDSTAWNCGNSFFTFSGA